MAITPEELQARWTQILDALEAAGVPTNTLTACAMIKGAQESLEANGLGVEWLDKDEGTFAGYPISDTKH